MARGRAPLTPDVKLSKALSYILRHGAEKERIPIRSDGYICLKDLYKSSRVNNYSLQDIKRVVNNNDKKRFKLVHVPPGVDPASVLRKEEDEQHDGNETGNVSSSSSPEQQQQEETDTELKNWYIRANQGHSLSTVEVNLQPLKQISDFPNISTDGTPIVIHGTNWKAWQQIKQSGYLSRMNRTHIHMAPGRFGEDSVVSGMRASANVFIYIDIAKALESGIEFYKSENLVILSKGDSDGRIPIKFFSKVEVRQRDGTITLESLSL